MCVALCTVSCVVSMSVVCCECRLCVVLSVCFVMNVVCWVLGAVCVALYCMCGVL